MRGALITVEGVEGSGKSTQCRRLAEHLRRRGYPVALTSEPDGTPLGRAAVRALLERAGPPPRPLAAAFLFMAARHQHVSDVIEPALQQGALVVSDRFTDATLAYQGYGQGLDLQTVRELNALATGGLTPDLTLVLDLDPAAGLARIGDRRLDAFERLDLDFHGRVREGYLEIARAEKGRVAVLDGALSPDALHAEVAQTVDEWLERRGLRPGTTR